MDVLRLMARHDLGCRCWPHVSEADATEAIIQAATAEYRENGHADALREVTTGPCPNCGNRFSFTDGSDWRDHRCPAAEPPALDVERMDMVVEELRGRGYVIPEASTIASTYARLAREGSDGA